MLFKATAVKKQLLQYDQVFLCFKFLKQVGATDVF